MYCDETYLYYDCSDIDMYEPNMENDVCADQLWEFFHDKETQKATIPGMHTSKVAFEKQCIELELYKVAEEIVNSNFIEEYNKTVKF